MSSDNSPGLVLELRRPWLRTLPAAVLLLFAMVVPWLIRTADSGLSVVVTVLALGAAAVAIWQAGVGRPATRLVAVVWGQDQQWRLRFGTDEPIAATLLGRSWCSPWLMCFKFHTETGSRHQIMVWYWELSPIAWQQWQLRLRLDVRQVTTSQTEAAA